MSLEVRQDLLAAPHSPTGRPGLVPRRGTNLPLSAASYMTLRRRGQGAPEKAELRQARVRVEPCELCPLDLTATVHPGTQKGVLVWTFWCFVAVVWRWGSHLSLCPDLLRIAAATMTLPWLGEPTLVSLLTLILGIYSNQGLLLLCYLHRQERPAPTTILMAQRGKACLDKRARLPLEG